MKVKKIIKETAGADVGTWYLFKEKKKKKGQAHELNKGGKVFVPRENDNLNVKGYATQM